MAEIDVQVSEYELDCAVRCYLHFPAQHQICLELERSGFRTLAALSEATSANPLRTSQGATRPEAGSSPVSSSSSKSEEFAEVTFEDVGACLLLEPGCRATLACSSEGP